MINVIILPLTNIIHFSLRNNSIKINQTNFPSGSHPTVSTQNLDRSDPVRSLFVVEDKEHDYNWEQLQISWA